MHFNVWFSRLQMKSQNNNRKDHIAMEANKIPNNITEYIIVHGVALRINHMMRISGNFCAL